MAHVNDLSKSNYIGKSDCKEPTWFTVVGCSKANMAKEGEKPNWEVVLNFHETEKPFILKSTNGQLVHHFTGQGDYEKWQGVRIQLHVDPTISFGGKIVGGVRVKAAMNPQGTRPEQPPQNTFQPPPEYDPTPPRQPGEEATLSPQGDDIPF